MDRLESAILLIVVTLVLAACGSGTIATTTTVATTTTAPQQVRVPDVVGSEASQARANLIAAGFAVKSTERLMRGETPGLVLEQIPPAGSTVEPATVVELIIPKPFPTAPKSPPTTAVDATGAIESIRRVSSMIFTTTGIPTLADVRTDAQLITKMERFCLDVSRAGIDSAIQTDLESLLSFVESSGRDMALAQLTILEVIWINATNLYCPENESVVQGWLDKITEELGR